MSNIIIFLLGFSISLNLLILTVLYVVYRRNNKSTEDNRNYDDFKEKWGRFWRE